MCCERKVYRSGPPSICLLSLGFSLGFRCLGFGYLGFSLGFWSFGFGYLGFSLGSSLGFSD
jgi:hypothetical protein